MPVELATRNGLSGKNKRILFGYYAAFTLLLVSFMLMFITNSKQSTHAKEVQQTNRYLRNLQELLAEIRSAESAVRGFIIIQDESLLTAYHGSEARADSILKEAHRLAPLGNGQRQQLDTIKVLLGRRYDLWEDALALFNKAGGDPVTEKIRHGKIVSDRLQRVVTDIEIAEQAALKDHTDQLYMYSRAVLPVNIITLVLAILLIGYSFFTYNREKRIAVEANRMRREKERQLELKVEELHKANDELIKFRRLEKFASTGRMARMIAHEVRNPLSNINLAISQLKDEPLNGNENSTLMYDIITRSSERINQLVTDLLNATRIQEMNFASASVNVLLDEALTAAADRAQLQQVRIIKEYTAGLCNVSADREKLKIAFLNIIVNAIEAMEPGKGVLKLKTESRSSKCIVSITDNGKGIDKDSLSKLFEPYFTSKPRGSGLGLANTQAIILTHKGSIEVESEPGKGTTFMVALEFIEELKV